MAKKQQPTQQPSRKVGGQVEKRSWDTPSRPITPTRPDPPTQPAPAPDQPAPTQPVPTPTQPVPAPDPQPSTDKK